jgi:PAS domain S-box-containing protein
MMTNDLHNSEQHRVRADALISLATETSALLRVPEFSKRLIARAAVMLKANSAALALEQDSKLETVAVHGSNGSDSGALRRLGFALGELIVEKPALVYGSAAELLGPALAGHLGWQDLTLARLHGREGELIGVLCLANRGAELDPEDQQLLQAIVGHASVALENARLFTRMDQANRHWVEIFDAISDFIVVHDAQHNVLRVNRPMADFIGVRPTELIGLSMSALLSLETQAAPRSCPFCRNGIDGPDEFVRPVLERTYLVSTSQIHGSESESLQTIHVLKDITDRREAERRYRELFDNIQEGLFFTTPDGRFIEVNDALVRMLGYDSREQILQADIPAQIYLTPERRREISQLMEQHGSLRNYHETLRRKDGSVIHVLMNAFAVRDAQGQTTQFRGLMLDITDLTNFQSELQRERDFSSKILNNTQSLILVADTAGLISYANRRWHEAGGYEQQQLVGHPLAELIALSRRQAILEALHATLAGQQVDNLELPVMRADGRTGQFSVNLSPMRDDHGHVSSIVVVMSDITDAALLQAKLMHTEKLAAVGQLVSGVAHEVNNPLTAILGFADLMMENPELPDSARKDLRVILQEAQRTKQIVQNLLSFARQMPPQRRALQLNQILGRTLQLRAYDFSSHGVDIVQHFHETLPEVVGDSHQLQQVFLNIINNAYDAVRETGRPPRIEIMTASTPGFVEIAFRDNGDGITHIERIFDPFFTTKEVGKGTGLGLSICYGIVREHGGEIYCHNNDDGPGATFIVRLPAISEPAILGASAGVLQP